MGKVGERIACKGQEDNFFDDGNILYQLNIYINCGGYTILFICQNSLDLKLVNFIVDLSL